jgi:hypothetical protein
MEQLTTYRVKGKDIGLIFLFKYDLKGNLKLFEIVEGSLVENQINWLFRGFLPKDVTDPLPFTTQMQMNSYLQVRFPAYENLFKKDWLQNKEMKAKFDIERSPADISFEAFWKAYPSNPLSKKYIANQRFLKMSEQEKIKLFNNLPDFIKYKKQENSLFPYAEVFIHQRWWDK